MRHNVTCALTTKFHQMNLMVSKLLKVIGPDYQSYGQYGESSIEQ